MTQDPTRTALITGAAAGIGRATALKFARNGYRVGAFDIDLDGLQSLVAEAGSNCDIVTGSLDVRSTDDWQLALAQLCADDGRLDVLVNNAGILQVGRFAEVDLAAQTRTVEVNVVGTMNGCHTAYPYLRRADGAHVINLCSASAIYGQAELATYSATKFAVRGLTEALDLEWKDEGITVTALWPLFVDTAMTDGMDIGTTRALGIRLKPQDVAEAAYQAATAKRQTGVHKGVGIQSRLMMRAADMSPSVVNRFVNKYLAGR